MPGPPGPPRMTLSTPQYPPPAPHVPTLLPATRTRLQMRAAMGLEARQLQGWFSNRRLKEKAKEMGVPSWQLRAREMRAAYTEQKVPARTPDELRPHQHMLKTLSTCSRASAIFAHRSRPRPCRLIRGSKTCDAVAAVLPCVSSPPPERQNGVLLDLDDGECSAAYKVHR